MPKSKPSPRSSGNVTLSFGAVMLPTTLYGGVVSDHGVKRNEYVVTDDGDHPVGRGQIDKVTGELLPPGAEVVKKIQTEHGPVFVEDHEIENLFELSPDTLEIKKFQPLSTFNEYAARGLMFLEPRKVGSGSKKAANPKVTQAIKTILVAMEQRDALAMCELTTRGVPKPAILLPDGRIVLIHHTDATREQRQVFDGVEVKEADVTMMGQFMQMYWSDEAFDFTDERTALIQSYADEKAAAGDFTKPVEEQVAAVLEDASGFDLAALLAQSIENAKAGAAA